MPEGAGRMSIGETTYQGLHPQRLQQQQSHQHEQLGVPYPAEFPPLFWTGRPNNRVATLDHLDHMDFCPRILYLHNAQAPLLEVQALSGCQNNPPAQEDVRNRYKYDTF